MKKDDIPLKIEEMMPDLAVDAALETGVARTVLFGLGDAALGDLDFEGDATTLATGVALTVLVGLGDVVLGDFFGVGAFAFGVSFFGDLAAFLGVAAALEAFLSYLDFPARFPMFLCRESSF